MFPNIEYDHDVHRTAYFDTQVCGIDDQEVGWQEWNLNPSNQWLPPLQVCKEKKKLKYNQHERPYPRSFFFF